MAQYGALESAPAEAVAPAQRRRALLRGGVGAVAVGGLLLALAMISGDQNLVSSRSTRAGAAPSLVSLALGNGVGEAMHHHHSSSKSGSSTPSPTYTKAPTPRPTAAPTPEPTTPKPSTSFNPTPLTWAPTGGPTPAPSGGPSYLPTHAPTDPPTIVPTSVPTASPTASHYPSPVPTAGPSYTPTPAPTTIPTSGPSYLPTPVPSPGPTATPQPSVSPLPSYTPTPQPSVTDAPTPRPTTTPTPGPSADPTPLPTPRPTHTPTSSPTPVPSTIPSPAPSGVPTSVPSPRPTPHTPSPTAVLAFSMWTEGYSPRNFSWYPWQYIVEPHRNTHFKVEGYDKKLRYEWNVESLCEAGCGNMRGHTRATHGENGVAFANGTTPEFVIQFKKAASQYVLSLTATDASGEYIVGAITGIPLMCKYVRREIRDLTRDDREKFLSALEITHRVPYDEGQTMYAGKYMDAVGLTRKHLAKMTLDRCTPYHNGKVFFPAHASFSLEMEQSLQTIDPSISMPYWDYTIDNLFFGQDWPSSPIWSDELFGSVSPNTSGHVINSGRFAYTPIRTDPDAPERNGYGRITDRMNADPVRYVTRGGREVCGVRTRKTLPGCNELHYVVNSKNLEQLDHNVEYNFHGYIHMLLGGAWDCKQSLNYDKLQKELSIADLPGYVEDLAMNMNVLWRYFFFAGYLKFPDGCTSDTDFAHCRGTCPLIDYRVDDLTHEQVYKVLDTGDVLSAMTDYMIVVDNITGKYIVNGLDYNGSITFYRWLIPVLCGPGKMAAFATPLAATNDPVFWISHNAYERIWAWMRLKPTRNKRWNDNWSDDNSTCSGHNYHDSVPWKNFLNEGKKDDYTNQELVQLFDPRNPELPHVYDNFAWDHCDWNPELVPTIYPTLHPPPTPEPTPYPTAGPDTGNSTSAAGNSTSASSSSSDSSSSSTNTTSTDDADDGDDADDLTMEVESSTLSRPGDDDDSATAEKGHGTWVKKHHGASSSPSA